MYLTAMLPWQETRLLIQGPIGPPASNDLRQHSTNKYICDSTTTYLIHISTEAFSSDDQPSTTLHRSISLRDGIHSQCHCQRGIHPTAEDFKASLA